MRLLSNKKFRIVISSVLMAAMMVVPSFADEQGDLEAENSQLESQLADEQARVAELQANISDLNSEIDAIDEELDRIQGIIDDYEAQKAEKQATVEELNAKIAELEESIASDEEEIAHEYSLMKMRIKFLYENVGDSYIEAIFSSTSVSEAVEKIQYLLEITNYDRKMMEQVKALVSQVEDEKTEMETDAEQVQSELDDIEALETAQAAQQELYEETKALKEDEKADAEYELDEAQAIIDAFNAEISANQDQINSLIAEYEAQLAAQQAAEEASRAAAEEAARAAAEEASRAAEEASREAEENGEEFNSDDYTVPETTESYSSSSSGFIWPLSGYYTITSYFGYRGDDPDLPEDSNLTYHQGVDIYAPSGTPIHAVADGVVVVSGWSDAIGWYMAIYHGNGIFSEMHHMSSQGLGVGTTVSQGETVGYVGATGTYCYGAHLHFGICTGSDSWALANYVNPLNYIG